MGVHKIVSFCVVILLITMLFAGVVTIPAAAQSTPFAITSINPTNNTVNVPVTKTINVTFNKTVQQGTNYSNIALKKGTNRVNSTITITSDTLAIKPNATLAYDTSYTVFIPNNGVKNGTETTSDFTSHFTTVASPTKGSTLNAPATTNATSNVTSITTKMPTALALITSNTTPAVNQSVTFTATLKSGTTSLSSKSVTIYHYLNGARYNDTTNATNATGQLTFATKWTTPGQRTYYATFAGDSSHQASTSSVLTINVDAQTNVTLTASNTTPAVNQSVTFNATLSWWNPTTSQWLTVTGQPIQIWHTLNGVRYNDTTINTNNSGTATFTQKWAPAGTRYYYATFAGDAWYKTFTSSAVTVNVQIDTQTIYYVPQTGSTWVNQGTAGASYNAYVSTPSLFQIQSNGYPYWGNITQNDFICIPAGSATNNQNVASWEIGFHFTGLVSGQRYQKIWDKACGGFFFEIDTSLGANNSELTIYRATTGGSGARWYIPTDTVLRAGHNYYIQIAWNTSAGPGNEPYPTVWIGEDGNAPVLQTHFDESGNALGGTGSWYNDAVGSANLGNTASDAPGNASAKIDPLNGGFFVYRQFSSIVNFSNGGNWNTDKLRWT